MSFNSTVEKVQKALVYNVDVANAEDFAVTIHLTDEKNEGRFFIAVTDGIFRVEPFKYDDNGCELSMTVTVLNSIISGKSNIQAGIDKDKIGCEGDVNVALKLQDVISTAFTATAEVVEEEKPAPVKKAAAKKPVKEVVEKPAEVVEVAEKPAEVVEVAEKPAEVVEKPVEVAEKVTSKAPAKSTKGKKSKAKRK